MKKAAGIALLGAAGLLVGGTTYGALAKGGATAPKSPQVRVVKLDASWATMYKSVGELKKNSDLAVSGTFGEVVDQTGDPHTLLYRDYSFTVTKVLHAGAAVSVHEGDVITIHQTGGVASGIKQEIADDPLFASGDKAVLFLHQDGPKAYHVIGGPSGRFKVNAGGGVARINEEGVPFSGSIDSLDA